MDRTHQVWIELESQGGFAFPFPVTGTCIPRRSSAGWSELWSRESEETTWLRWGFAAVEEMASLDQLPDGQPSWLPYQILGNQLIVRLGEG